ncbi:hypothetical protein V1515DRAFT_640859 [Lipomyces mesembrius]
MESNQESVPIKTKSASLNSLPLQDSEQFRPPFEVDAQWHCTKTKAPEWVIGSGANDASWRNHRKVSMDPAERSVADNYRLLVSAIIPRPVGLVSTISRSGVLNLSPFSYLTIVNTDPAIFCIGFSLGRTSITDSLNNVLETGELALSMTSEWFVEAANLTSTNAPSEISEWDLSGLTASASEKIKPPHVAESAFSVECILMKHHHFRSAVTGQITGVLCIVEGVHFHIREDAFDEAKGVVDPSVLRPIARLGGWTYSRTTTGFEVAWPEWSQIKVAQEVQDLLGRQHPHHL